MGYNILIVEDSKLVSDNIRTALELDGHTIQQAFDLQSGNELLSSHNFDYLLLDLILPDGEGEMLLPYAKAADVRTIVMTTDRDTFRRDRIFGFGIVDYIVKDRFFDDIIDSLRRMIKQVESNNNFTILVIDDSNFIRNHMELLLHSRGYLVLTATNGQEALKMMKRFQIDALIVDLHMPVMDGFEFIGKVRRDRDNRSLPIMVLTGSNDSTLIAKAIKHDVKDLIKKPYVTEEMLLKIDNMMNDLMQKKIINEEHQKVLSYQNAIMGSSLSLTLTSDLIIKSINPLLAKLLHGTESTEPFVGKKYQDMVKNPSLEMLRNIKRLGKNNPEEADNYNGIFEFHNESQTPCFISGTFSTLKGPSEENELLFIGFDVTQIHLTQKQLEKQVEQQIQTNYDQQQIMFHQSKMAAMGEMIGNIAHQWRQPLNLIGLYIQNLKLASELNTLNDAYIENMVTKSMAQIEFMSSTVDDFRNFFQPNKQKKRFDVVDAIDKTLTIINTSLDRNHIKLVKMDFQEDTYHINGYQSELQQVLLNLINNAKDAINEKSLKSNSDFEKVIIISLKQMDMTLTISIEDTGGGIEESIMNRIFEPYYTTKGESIGTGIGLYMSKMIIEQSMNGQLKVNNGRDGACFTIVLPAEEGI